MLCGIDEVGRGPLAGPVIACACILPEHLHDAPEYALIRDSKAMTAKARERVSAWLRAHSIYALGEASVEEIDSINILQATFRAMERAVDALPVAATHALVDGNGIPKLTIPCKAIIGGDASVPEIAAASIIAKVHRDALMAKLAEKHPHYGWHTNAGYGSKTHMEAMKIHGVTIHHRRSFAPVRSLLAS